MQQWLATQDGQPAPPKLTLRTVGQGPASTPASASPPLLTVASKPPPVFPASGGVLVALLELHPPSSAQNRINIVLSEHARAARGVDRVDPEKPRFFGSGGACRLLMTASK